MTVPPKLSPQDNKDWAILWLGLCLVHTLTLADCNNNTNAPPTPLTKLSKPKNA
ncbi:hypothetical protein [Moraxella lacunata]|uniref:hypothetical protein n=1 Tax=Moraxella lacunata TaxID=477 RepID=UPI003EE13330